MNTTGVNTSTVARRPAATMVPSAVIHSGKSHIAPPRPIARDNDGSSMFMIARKNGSMQIHQSQRHQVFAKTYRKQDGQERHRNRDIRETARKKRIPLNGAGLGVEPDGRRCEMCVVTDHEQHDAARHVQLEMQGRHPEPKQHQREGAANKDDIDDRVHERPTEHRCPEQS